MSFQTIPEMFISLCEKYGNQKHAFEYKKNGVWIGITHAELREEVECFALGLLNLGIRTGDRIGIVSENRIEWAIADLGIVSIGAIDVPLFPTLTSKQEEWIFNDCQVTAVIVSNNFQLGKILEVKENIPTLRHIIVMNKDIEALDVAVKTMEYISNRGAEVRSREQRREIIVEASAKVKPDDILTLIYTSGTTGNPKGVILTHLNVTANVIGSVEAVLFTEKDRFLTYLPWCHSYERTTGYYAAFSCGATIYFAESIESVAVNIKEVKPTYITTVPRMMEVVRKKILSSMENEKLIKQKIFKWSIDVGINFIYSKLHGDTSYLASVKYRIANSLVFSKIREKIGCDYLVFVSGGAALSPEIAEFFMTIGYDVIEGYGLTEASPVVAATRIEYPEGIEIGTVGKPLGNVEIKIAEDGEILVKGLSIMKGYWGDAGSSEVAVNEDGWLYTGDIGEFTSKGNLKITDRKKNIFVSSGGKNIAPQPIENLLAQSQYIEQCILIGDKREFCTALITPDFNQLKKIADNFEIHYDNPTELISNDKIVKTIKDDIDRLQKDLAKFERVRKFKLLSEPFTVENGVLTPKLSIRRFVVEKKYNDLIDQMYYQ